MNDTHLATCTLPDSTPRTRSPLVLACSLALALVASQAQAAAVPTGFVDEQVAGAPGPSLTLPVGLAFLPDGRMLAVEKNSGNVRLVRSTGAVSIVGTVQNLTNIGERGLEGIAVDPQWPARPYIYVHYTYAGNVIRISRFTVTGDLGNTGSGTLAFDVASEYVLLDDLDDINHNHNGGTVRFGTDGYLYVSLGEDAQGCQAQDPTTLLGVILRLDVGQLPAGPGGPAAKSLLVASGNPYENDANENARLVWALGLRNPFRFHIDPVTGDLFVADVGHDLWEEIDRIPVGGINLGWPRYEGSMAFSGCPHPVTTYTDPIYAYGHEASAKAVVSAGLYRRPGGALQLPPEYDGDYFFSDFYDGKLRRLEFNGSTWEIAAAVAGQPEPGAWGVGYQSASDFVVGPDGAIYYTHMDTQTVRRIRYAGTTAVDPTPRGSLRDDGATYDLQGRRVQDDPKRSGVYFTRGKKKVIAR